MDRRWVTEICRHFGVQPTVDAFATAANSVVPRFFAWHQDARAAGLDAMLQDWSREETIWINPPFRMMDQVVRKLTMQPPKRAAIVIAPVWPTTSWFSSLCRAAAQRLPVPSSAIQHGPLEVLPEPLRNPKWQLEAFLIPSR